MKDKLAEVRAEITEARQKEARVNGGRLPQKSLYELLQENELKKDEYFERIYAERNALKRLDPDEASYIQSLRDLESRKEKERKAEEARSLEEFRKQATNLRKNTHNSTKTAPTNASSAPVSKLRSHLITSKVTKSKPKALVKAKAKELSKDGKTRHAENEEPEGREQYQNKQDLPEVGTQGSPPLIDYDSD